jgi:hypothetical protein
LVWSLLNCEFGCSIAVRKKTQSLMNLSTRVWRIYLGFSFGFVVLSREAV